MAYIPAVDKDLYNNVVYLFRKIFMLDNAGIKIAQGEKISCEHIEGVNDNMSEPHYHEFFELYYLEGGERYNVIENELAIMKAGDFMLFAPYMMHHSYGRENIPFKRIVLYFDASEIESKHIYHRLISSCGFYHSDRGSVSFSVHRILEMLLAEEDSTAVFSTEYKRILLNLLIITILRQTKPEPENIHVNRINQIIHFIHNNYKDVITLEILSKKFFISKYHLSREFKKITHKTVVQYINSTRIMNAQRKIMETKKTLTEISSETGFSSLTHFNRVFKSETNQNPSEFRKIYLSKRKNTVE